MTSKRHRSANYSSREREVLFSIVTKYKHIIENKKTDAVSQVSKTETWEYVAQQFNACAPNLIHRTGDSLKKFYENKKKQLRKEQAEEKMNIYKTGGGPPPPHNPVGHSNDILLSLINKKTVFGLENTFDSDSTSYTMGQNSTKCQLYEYESDKNDNREKEEKDDVNTNVEDNRNELKGKEKRKIQYSSRRRPATTVKALTSSNIADKYEKLIDKRLEISNYEISKLTNTINYDKDEHNLRTEALQLDILIKKETLKKLYDKENQST